MKNFLRLLAGLILFIFLLMSFLIVTQLYGESESLGVLLFLPIAVVIGIPFFYILVKILKGDLKE